MDQEVTPNTPLSVDELLDSCNQDGIDEFALLKGDIGLALTAIGAVGLMVKRQGGDFQDELARYGQAVADLGADAIGTQKLSANTARACSQILFALGAALAVYTSLAAEEHAPDYSPLKAKLARMLRETYPLSEAFGEAVAISDTNGVARQVNDVFSDLDIPGA